MHRLAVVTMALALGAAAGCQSSEQKQAEEASKQAAKAIEQAAKTSEQGASRRPKVSSRWPRASRRWPMAPPAPAARSPWIPSASASSRRSFPISTAGKKQKPTGERMTMPFSFSQAEVHYRKGESRLEIKIVDSGFNQLLFTPYAMFMQQGYEKETSTRLREVDDSSPASRVGEVEHRGQGRRAQRVRRQALPPHGRRPQRRRHQGAARGRRQGSISRKLAALK